jgi:hypothetical protein
MNILLRLATILIAGFSIWQFSDGFWLAMQTLGEPQEVRWFNLLSAVAEGVLGPGLALTAIALAVFKQAPPGCNGDCSVRARHLRDALDHLHDRHRHQWLLVIPA